MTRRKTVTEEKYGENSSLDTSSTIESRRSKHRIPRNHAKKNKLKLSPALRKSVACIQCKEIVTSDWLVFFDFVSKYMSIYAGINSSQLEDLLCGTAVAGSDIDAILQKILLDMVPNTSSTSFILCGKRSGVEQMLLIKDMCDDITPASVVSDLKDLLNFKTDLDSLHNMESKCLALQRKVALVSKLEKDWSSMFPDSFIIEVLLSSLPTNVRDLVEATRPSSLNDCVVSMKKLLRQQKPIIEVCEDVSQSSIEVNLNTDQDFRELFDQSKYHVKEGSVKESHCIREDLDEDLEIDWDQNIQNIPFVITSCFLFISFVLVFFVGLEIDE